jgi:hypothetical protein
LQGRRRAHADNRFGPLLAALVAGPIEVTTFEPVALGDGAKGRLGG